MAMLRCSHVCVCLLPTYWWMPKCFSFPFFTAVMADGNVEVQPHLLLSFTHLLASKQTGEEVAVSVIRQGRALDLVCR